MTGMPAWEFRLSDDDMWAIVAYLQVLPAQSPRRMPARAAFALSVPRRDCGAGRRRRRRGARRAALQQYACATCHAIPGIVGANAPVGPPLDGDGTRGYIAGMMPNTPDDMVRWLRAAAGKCIREARCRISA